MWGFVFLHLIYLFDHCKQLNSIPLLLQGWRFSYIITGAMGVLATLLVAVAGDAGWKETQCVR